MKENPNEDEIDFGIIFRIIWSEKKLLAICVLIFEVLAVARLQLATPTYDVSMIVASPTKETSALDRGILGSVGGLMGLAGVGGQTNFDKYQVIMVSSGVAEQMLHNQDFAKRLFAGQWDEKAGEWQPPGGVRPLVRRAIRFSLGMEGWHQPDSEIMSGYLRGKVQFDVDKDNGFLEITVNHTNPELAVELLQALHQETNRIVRDAASIRTANRIAYLTQTLPGVKLDSHRDVLIEMLSTEGQKMIMVEADNEYAAEIVTPPVVPRKRATPEVSVMILMMGILGGVIGICLVFWKSREQLRKAWA